MQRSLNIYVVGDNLDNVVHPPYCVKSTIESMAKEIKQKPASKTKGTLILQHINRPLSSRCAHTLNVTFWRHDRPPNSSSFAGTDPELREKCSILGLAARKECHRQQMWLLGNCARFLRWLLSNSAQKVLDGNPTGKERNQRNVKGASAQCDSCSFGDIHRE